MSSGRDQDKKKAAENIQGPKKVYKCKYCEREFSTSQALGGHQNGHRQERESAKMMERQAELYAIATQQAQSIFSSMSNPIARDAYRQVPMNLFHRPLQGVARPQQPYGCQFFAFPQVPAARPPLIMDPRNNVPNYRDPAAAMGGNPNWVSHLALQQRNNMGQNIRAFARPAQPDLRSAIPPAPPSSALILRSMNVQAGQPAVGSSSYGINQTGQQGALPANMNQEGQQARARNINGSPNEDGDEGDLDLTLRLGRE